MVVSEGGAVSYERGTPVRSNRGASPRSIGPGIHLNDSAVDPGYSRNPFVQRYLAHKKLPPPLRTNIRAWV